MATKTIEFRGYPGLVVDDILIAKRSGATGTATKVSLDVVADTQGMLYTLVLSGDPLGKWSITGGYANRLVTFRANEDEEFWIGDEDESLSGGAGQYKITVTTQLADETKIRGVRASVDGTDTMDTTGTLGTAELWVDDGETYSVVAVPPFGYETPEAQSVTVDGEHEPITFTLTRTMPPESDDPSKCMVAVRIRDNLMALVDGAIVTAEVDRNAPKPAFVDTSVILGSPAAETTENGVAYFELARNVVYKITAKKGENRQVSWLVTVPDASSWTASQTV